MMLNIITLGLVTHHNDTRLNDTHHNDIQHKITRHNGIQRSLKLNMTQHNDTQHNGRVSIIIIVNYAECHYAKCRCTECRGANCQIANNMLKDHIKVICFNNSYIVSNQKKIEMVIKTDRPD